MDYENLYVAEYSVIQQCGHIETLKQAMKNNRFVCLNKTGADYLIIAVGETYDEMEKELNNFKKEIESED